MPATLALLKGAFFGFITSFIGCFIYAEGMDPGPTPLADVLDAIPWHIVGIVTAVFALLWLLAERGWLGKAFDAGDLLGTIFEFGAQLLQAFFTV